MTFLTTLKDNTNLQHVLRPKFHEPLGLKKRSEVGFAFDGERSSEDGEQPSVDNSPNWTRFMYRIAGTTTTIYKYAVVSGRDNITYGWRTYERADFTIYSGITRGRKEQRYDMNL